MWSCGIALWSSVIKSNMVLIHYVQSRVLRQIDYTLCFFTNQIIQDNFNFSFTKDVINSSSLYHNTSGKSFKSIIGTSTRKFPLLEARGRIQQQNYHKLVNYTMEHLLQLYYIVTFIIIVFLLSYNVLLFFIYYYYFNNCNSQNNLLF